MGRQAYLHFWSSCITALLLFGCTEDPVEESAECRQGETRELACGRYGTSVQNQVCGPRFRWINDGICEEDIECTHDEKRVEPCGGLNDNAYREKVCTLGEWPEQWSACIDPDVCVNDAVETEYCVGPAGGLNGNATKERVCVDGQWAAYSACVDPDSCTDNRPDLNDCVDNASCQLHDGAFACHCDAGFLDEEGQCIDINECEEELSNCDEISTCVNTPGSFYCACPPGRIDANGDGTDCKTVKEVTLSGDFSCAITTENELYCWGKDANGQFGGAQTTEPQRLPIAAGPDEQWSAVDAYGAFTRAISDAGEVFYWGGRPGHSLPAYSSLHVARKIADFRADDISVGYDHTCAIGENGKLYCWGMNFLHQLGDGSGDPSALPIQIGNNDKWWRVSAGRNHSCAIQENAAVYCWGHNNEGQVGSNHLDQSVSTPARVIDQHGDPLFLSTITAGSAHTCGISTTNPSQVYCWGSHHNGQLGIDAPTNNVSHNIAHPVVVPGANGFKAVAAGALHTCAVTTNGELYCWGYNQSGQLGDGLSNSQPSPKRITNATDWTDVFAGTDHTCGLRGEDLYCWGLNNEGQVGSGVEDNNHWLPTPIGGQGM